MKRILICTMSVLLLVPLMVAFLSVSASASTEYNFIPDDQFFVSESIVSDGMYEFYLSFVDDEFEPETSFILKSSEPFTLSFDTIDENSLYQAIVTFPCILISQDDFETISLTCSVELSVLSSYDYGGLSALSFEVYSEYTNLSGMMQLFLSGYSSELKLIPHESSPPFLSSVTECLTTSIRWCGSVISALVSGELSSLLPLMAISVSIAVLLLAYKVIKKYTWGA